MRAILYDISGDGFAASFADGPAGSIRIAVAAPSAFAGIWCDVDPAALRAILAAPEDIIDAVVVSDKARARMTTPPTVILHHTEPAPPPPPIGPAVTFGPASPNSAKVACSVCGAKGYPANGRGWQKGCLRGHRPCDRCGRMLTVRLDGSPRIHARCPDYTPPPCRECREGKHGNCNGDTWDDANDAPAACPCHIGGH